MRSSSVLYDAPGPLARRRYAAFAVAFVVVLAAVTWWVLAEMAAKQQLDWEKWAPYLGGTEAWEAFLLPGLLNTLSAALVSIAIALPIGFVFGIARLSEHAFIRVPASAVVEFFRAIPVLILMLFANTVFHLFTDVSSDARPLYAVVTGLVLYNGSVLAEVVRAGVLSLPRGQSEAGAALGLRRGHLTRLILLPQAVTAMLPAIVSQLVVVVKDTAIGGAILGFGELIAQARPAQSYYQANTIATLTVIAVIFIGLNFVLTTTAGRLERWLRTRHSRAA